MASTHVELSRLHRRSLQNIDHFWGQVAEKLVWTKKWTTVVDDSRSLFTKWFVGGEMNVCYNCVDVHVENGRGENLALIFNSPLIGAHVEYTYAQFQEQVSLLGGVLSSLGVSKGDVVMIYMPMIPEGAFAMLTCARLGALHVCVPSGLTSIDLAPKLQHSKPKIVILASHGYHSGGWQNYKTILDEACDKSEHKPKHLVVFQRKHMDRVSMQAGRDVDWTERMTSSVPAKCVPMEANEPLFMVYTSGTSGSPKAIVHAGGRFAVRQKLDGPSLFGSPEQGDIMFGTTYLGWIGGHFLITYGPFMAGITALFFEGDPLLTNDVHTLYKIISENKVTRCYVRPGILKIIKGKDNDGRIREKYNFESLKHIYAGGERMDMNTMLWVSKTFNAPVWNMWGQTETGTIVTGSADVTVPKDSNKVVDFGPPLPGWDVVIKKPDGSDATSNEVGRVLFRLPLPPGALLTIFGDDDLCFQNYFKEFPGFYDSRDEGALNVNGELKVLARIDDIMKIGQVYIASQAMEEVIMSHLAVAECVVVSTPHLEWKEIPIALYTMKIGSNLSPRVVATDIETMVSSHFGASIIFGGAILVKELPMTRTGKVHRPSCKDMARGNPVKGADSVENPHVFKDIQNALKKENYGRNALLD